MGHTEAVAMAHYRQSTGKAADKFYEQAATENTAAQKTVGKTVGEHAGMGCFGIEVENSDFATSPYISIVCDAYQDGAKRAKNAQVTPTGLEPVPRP